MSEDFLKKNHSDANMLVAIWVRPLSEREIADKENDIVSAEDKLLIVLDRIQLWAELTGIKPDVLHWSKEQRYYFDKIFKNVSQAHVYENTTKHLIPGITSGFNACVFAYGTTGSGKTYTMLGTDSNPGISVQTINDMFNAISSDPDNKYSIKVSYVEIYNEVIRDLLVAHSKNTYLDLWDDPIKGIKIAGVTEHKVE